MPSSYRFIPTCVGKRARNSRRDRGSAVHPHVCGEKAFCLVRLVGVSGSSPRVWGKVRPYQFCNLTSGFIPTCVGKRPQNLSKTFFLPVHPHVCGEKGARLSPKQGEQGSSPRVWGKASHSRIRTGCRWFIPTCVGKSVGVDAKAGDFVVHPHVCGEKPERSRDTRPPLGSSPRVWGKVVRKAVTDYWGRFIPTCVGKSVSVRIVL